MKISIDLKEGTIKKDKDQKIIVGIDLGTTNSLIACIVDGKPEIIASDSSNLLVPSVIHFKEDGEIIVGNEAIAMLDIYPERTIYSSKRLMGKSYQDISKSNLHFQYRIIKNDDEQSLVKIEIGNNFYSPIELSSKILHELKVRAEKIMQAKIESAVITVPAYFNDAQRQATRDAGKLAGLDVLRIINEPTAASLAYGLGLDQNQSKTIAVYDLGGGTFDISLLTIEDGIFEVLSTNGDTQLGGDDFDQALIDIIGSKVKSNSTKENNLRLLAADIKKYLSHAEVYVGTLNNIKFSISRKEFENAIAPWIDKTIASCQIALDDAKLMVSQIDHVVMVGGSTRIPYVKERVKSFFGKELNDEINPDTVVALGAAIQADILAGNRKDLLLLDITPLSLGIETVGGLMDPIIQRNSKIPSRAGRNYTTSIDGQKSLKIAVYQGERDLVEFNRKLGEFTLKNIPPMPAGLPKIEISFILDADGILTVVAKELRSGVESSVEIRSAYSINEEEMAMLLLDSLKNAQTDMEARALVEAINEANNVLLSSTKFILQNKDILSEDELDNLTTHIDKIKQSIEVKNKSDITNALDALNLYSRPLAERALDRAVQEALSGKNINAD